MTTTAVKEPTITGKWEAAMLAGGDAIAAYWAMYLVHNQNSALEIDYEDAMDDMHDYHPATSRDVVRKFVAMYSDGGFPNPERQDALILQAKAVLEREA